MSVCRLPLARRWNIISMSVKRRSGYRSLRVGVSQCVPASMSQLAAMTSSRVRDHLYVLITGLLISSKRTQIDLLVRPSGQLPSSNFGMILMTMRLFAMREAGRAH